MKYLFNFKRIKALPQVLILGLLFFGASGLAFSNSACSLDSVVKENPTDKINVMLLGDSITQGMEGFNGYRRLLHEELKKNGYFNSDDTTKPLIDFVGSWKKILKNGKHPFTIGMYKLVNDNNESDNDDSYDLGHEGHWGAATKWFVDGIQVEKNDGHLLIEKDENGAKGEIVLPPTISTDGTRVEGLEGLLTLIKEEDIPDIVLIHLGTNDLRLLSQLGEVADTEPAWTAVFNTYSIQPIISNLRKIIEVLRGSNPRVKILLAQIIPEKDPNIPDDNVINLNKEILKLNDENNLNSPICVVDHYSKFKIADLRDDYHPTEHGERIMAQTWFEALTGISLVGDKDFFKLGDPEDNPPLSDETKNIIKEAEDQIGSGIPAVGLDFNGVDRPVGVTHNFEKSDGQPLPPIKSATLELRFKGKADFHNDVLAIKTPWSITKRMELVMLKDLKLELMEEGEVVLQKDELQDIKLLNDKIWTAIIDLSAVPVRIRRNSIDWLESGAIFPAWQDPILDDRKAIMNWLPELRDGQLDLVISDDTTLDYSELTIKYGLNTETNEGSNVVVIPHPDVYVGFEKIEIGGAGETTVERITDQQRIANYRLGDNAAFYEIKTDANFSEEITIQFHYDESQFQQSDPKIYHIVLGTVLEVPSVIDRDNQIISTKVKTLSLFAIANAGSWSSICKPQEMEITGIGMGDRYKSTNPQSLSLHDPSSVDRLLAQVTGRYIRNNGTLQPIDVNFTTPNGELKTLTQPSYQNQFGYSYVLPLAPTSEVNATVQGSGENNEKTPRGLVLYTLRKSPDNWSSIGQILNEYIWGGDSEEDVTYSKTITFPPLQEATDLYVTAVVTDNNNDLRSMVVDAEAGGVKSSVSEDVPTEGDLLNIVELKLPAVPAGTTEAVITLRSLAVEGDSLIFSGVNVSYLCTGSERVQEGLETLYTFKEGSGATVNDVSGSDVALNLTINDETAVTWMTDGGLVINTPTIIQSAGAASNIIAASKASQEITIETWLKPKNVTQDGPARIVTLSENVFDRNFTLGQGRWGNHASDVFDIRLRTTDTTLGGMPSVTSSSGLATTSLIHLVYTRDAAGIARVYKDGVEVQSATVVGDFSSWDANYAFALGNELTQDRPWLGELHLVAVYSKALTTDEVLQNYSAGSGTTP